MQSPVSSTIVVVLLVVPNVNKNLRIYWPVGRTELVTIITSFFELSAQQKVC